MQLIDSFVPTAGQVGAPAMLTEWILTGATYAFGGAALFFALTRTSVAPRRRAAAALMAVVAAVSAFGHWTLAAVFHDLLHQLAATADPASKRRLVRDAYLAISPYRYTAWAVTMPLLALMIPLSLNARPREMIRPLAGLLAAALAAVLAGYLGEQGIAADGTILAGQRWGCGAVALVACATVPAILFRLVAPRFGGRAEHDEARAFRMMSWMTLTAWAIYPVVYVAPMLAPNMDFNWLHIALTAGDLVNQLGIGAIGYLAGAAELERRVPHEAVQSARIAT